MNKLTKKQFIDDLEKLISFKTLTSDVEENSRALDFIGSKIDKRAVIQRIKNGNTVCLIAGNKNTRKPDVCYLVHVDVVAGRPDQFKVKIKNGTAYGRGVSDMKFSIPIGYSLLNDLIAEKSPISFSFIVTTDEETGGYEGAQFLAKQYKLKPKVLIVPDGGDDFIFVNKSKGVCALRIEATGKPAHSSRRWEGVNAIEPIAELCSVLAKKYRKNNKKETWKTTMNIGLIQGGISANQVCPSAFATLDFRFPETESAQKILDEVTAAARRIDPNMKISPWSKGAPTSVDKNNPIVKKFISYFEKNLEEKVKIQGTYGASDARHFVDTGAPILMIKPTGGDIHGDNENINIDACLLFYKSISEFLKDTSENHW